MKKEIKITNKLIGYGYENFFKDVNDKNMKLEEKYEDINIIINEPESEFSNIIIYVHGLGSSSSMIERFSEKLSKDNIAICAFDLPAHGKDKKTFKEFNLTNSLIYLDKVIEYINNKYKDCKITLFGASYGAYVILNKLKKVKYPTILMSPAINFPDILKTKGNITKDCYSYNEYKHLYGEVKIYKDAFIEFCNNNVNEKNNNFSNIKIIHGTKDKTVDINIVKKFSEENNISLKVIENEVHELYSSDDIIVNYIKENIWSKI